jgi:hypothetical protein
MPKIAIPGEAPTGGPSLDLSPDLRDMTKVLKDNLTARTTADIYQKLTAPSDSSLPVMQGLGEALGGLAQGWKGVSEMQTALQHQLMEKMQQPGGHGGGVEELMKWMFVYKMFKEMSQEETAGKKTTSDEGPTWRDFLAEQERRHQAEREAEERARREERERYTPVSEQLMGAFYQIIGQNLQQSLMPSNPVDQVKQANAMVQELAQSIGADSHRSFQERRLERLDEMELRKLEYEYADRQQERQDRQKAREQDWPRLANSVVAGLQQLAAQFGFRPVGGPGGGQPSLVSPAAMAAAQQSQQPPAMPGGGAA